MGVVRLGLKEIIGDRRATAGVDSIVSKIVGLAIAIFVIASIIPTALTTIFNVSTSNWPAPVAGLWNLVPIFGVLGIVLLMVLFATKGWK